MESLQQKGFGLLACADVIDITEEEQGFLAFP
jgi:hypothetical protein